MTSKYRSVRCSEVYRDCGRHASLREHRRAQELRLLALAGEIRNLREQVVFELAPSVILNGRKKPPLRYVADFVYEQRLDAEPVAREAWVTVVEDAKGMATPEFRIKAHLMKAVHEIAVVLV